MYHSNNRQRGLEKVADLIVTKDLTVLGRHNCQNQFLVKDAGVLSTARGSSPKPFQAVSSEAFPDNIFSCLTPGSVMINTS